MSSHKETVTIKPETFWSKAAYRDDTHYDSGSVYKGYRYGGEWKDRYYVVVSACVAAVLLSILVVPLFWVNAKDRQRCHMVERVQGLDTEYHFGAGCVVKYDSNNKGTYDVNIHQEKDK